MADQCLAEKTQGPGFSSERVVVHDGGPCRLIRGSWAARLQTERVLSQSPTPTDQPLPAGWRGWRPLPAQSVDEGWPAGRLPLAKRCETVPEAAQSCIAWHRRRSGLPLLQTDRSGL